MPVAARIKRHLRLMGQASARGTLASPPFLILFMNSICNLTCDHCFYWKDLNSRNDLSREELFDLARSLGPIENLNLSGGEPFLREDMGTICRFFVTNNQVKRIYCPTNGFFTDRTKATLEEIFREEALDSFTVELSLDGMPEFHNSFRGSPQSFERAMATYDMLAEFQNVEPRLEIHAISTATGENVEEIKELTTYLFKRCPRMTHHNIAMIRGERKRETLEGPALAGYRDLVDYMASLWRDREASRFGAIVDPMLHWGKEQIARHQNQNIPCLAGRLTGVVWANGDVGLCEQHQPIVNLRQESFP